MKIKEVHISENQKNFKYSDDGQVLYRIGRNKLYVYYLQDSDRHGPGEFYIFSHIKDYKASRDSHLFS